MPNPSNRKYYFAWHLVHGDPYPFAWVEENDIMVGGRPDFVKGTKHEISQKDFEETDLRILEGRHPWVEMLPNVLAQK